MSGKQLSYSEEARRKLKRGVDVLARAVRPIHVEDEVERI